MIRTGLVVMLALLAPGAASADDVSDLQVFMCLGAMGAATHSPNKELARDALFAHAFWLGRIDPAMSQERMDELAGLAVEALNDNNAGPTLDRCGVELNRMNDAFGRTIETLQKQGKAR